jgi:hypothetical protein
VQFVSMARFATSEMASISILEPMIPNCRGLEGPWASQSPHDVPSFLVECMELKVAELVETSCGR